MVCMDHPKFERRDMYPTIFSIPSGANSSTGVPSCTAFYWPPPLFQRHFVHFEAPTNRSGPSGFKQPNKKNVVQWLNSPSLYVIKMFETTGPRAQHNAQRMMTNGAAAKEVFGSGGEVLTRNHHWSVRVVQKEAKQSELRQFIWWLLVTILELHDGFTARKFPVTTQLAVASGICQVLMLAIGKASRFEAWNLWRQTHLF